MMGPPLTAEFCPDHGISMSPQSVWYDQHSCTTWDTWVCPACKAAGLNGLFLLPRKMQGRTYKLDSKE